MVYLCSATMGLKNHIIGIWLRIYDHFRVLLRNNCLFIIVGSNNKPKQDARSWAYLEPVGGSFIRSGPPFNYE
jgi:hypothetical protein